MRKCSDGWHVIDGIEVYVENGYVARGISQSNEYDRRTVYPYRYIKAGYNKGYEREHCLTPDAFRAGHKRGTIVLR